jgi:tetratricopeptide (TPR) repeat protein
VPPRAAVLAALVSILAGVTLGGLPAAADRLHLEGGGHVDAESWWFDGNWIRYESKGGTIGIPRSIVVRIDPGDHADGPDPLAQGAPGAAAPAAGAGVGPERREEVEQLLRDGRDALAARQFERASSLYYQAIQSWPGLSVARVGYALAEMAQGNDARAMSAVLDGLRLDPERAELHELEGDLLDRDERVEDALDAWRRAFELSPSDRVREKILKSERDLHASRGFDLSTTPHFTVRYDGEIDLDLASAVMDYLEEQYWVLSDRFAHAPAQPITVLLYPSRQFRQVTQSPEWVGGLYDGKIRVPLGGLHRLDPVAKDVLVHELTHAVVHSKTRGNCPRWLHEGLAQVAEEKTIGRAERDWVAEQLSSGAPDEWDAKAFSYTLALSLTRYLESRGGPRSLVQLLDLLAEGRDVDAALSHLYGEDYRTICRRWAEAERRGRSEREAGG